MAKEEELTTIYKVVRRDLGDGQLKSIVCVRRYQIVYPEGEWVIHNTPMLVFDSLENARNFIRPFATSCKSEAEIWKGEARDIFAVRLVLPLINHQPMGKVEHFWEWPEKHASRIAPAGTLGTRELRLRKMIL